MSTVSSAGPGGYPGRADRQQGWAPPSADQW